MPLYESVFIARQDISQTQVEALLERFGGIVAEGGGEVGTTEYWGVRSLAYRIKKNRKGHYVMMSLDAPAPAIQEMERNMRLDEDVLRYLTLRVDAFEEGPSIMMQRGRDDRGRGGRRDRDDRRDRGERRDRDERRDAAPEAKKDEAGAAAPEEKKDEAGAVALEEKKDEVVTAAPEAKTDEAAEANVDEAGAAPEADAATTEQTDGGDA